MISTRLSRSCTALFIVCLLAAHAEAVDLSHKPVSAAEHGWKSNILNSNGQQVADDLHLTASGVASQLTWYGFRQDGGASANFRVRILSDSAGHPAITPFYDQPLGLLIGNDTGLDNPAGHSILQYSSAIPVVGLSAGTTYWLTIASTNSVPWFWSNAVVGPAGNDNFYRGADGFAWHSMLADEFGPTLLEQAFRLEGTIPEPASLASTGFAMTIFARRRRARAWRQRI